MPKVEVFANRDETTPFLIGEFTFLPRIGEYMSIDAGGYFSYYNIVEVWHRDEGNGVFIPCLRLALDD